MAGEVKIKFEDKMRAHWRLINGESSSSSSRPTAL